MKNTFAFTRLIKSAFLITSLLAFVSLQGCFHDDDDDPANPVVTGPTLTISAPSVVEGQTGTSELVFTITLSEDAASTLTVDYATSDDTATVADSDYTAVIDSVSILVGTRTATFSVFANSDTVFEADETFNLNISNPQGLAISTQTLTGQGTITNDDDADTRGYFTGSATLNGMAYADITAMAYANHLMVFSPSANVIYDITIDTVTVTDFTGTVNVYVDGNIEQAGSVTITGTTDESQVQGTFAGGTGFGVGSFDILFDTANNVGATLARMETAIFNDWEGSFYGIDVDTGLFRSSDVGRYSIQDNNADSCVSSSDLVIPGSTLNIFQLSHDVIFENIGSTCDVTYESTGHIGFASIYNDGLGGVDNKMVFAFANGTFALFGLMTK